MADYGLTPQGPNIKRLDVILDEMHKQLSEKWGVNTKQNPESLLNHLLTNIADQIAELWEFGEDVYFSQYPSTAEGTSLDNAAQYGGSTRDTAKKSYYPIHCTGTDGTVLAAGTMIASDTNPKTSLSLAEARTITRASFNRATIKMTTTEMDDAYTVALNGNVYSYEPKTGEQPVDILKGLSAAITGKEFSASVDEENGFLLITATDKSSDNALVLSENLTTETVTSIVTFGTVDTGDILLPDGVITQIVKADAGLLEVVNMCGYIAGRDEETDVEFRQSYADKIFNRSSMMLESIRSAILNNVQGVVSVAAYENSTNVEDSHGRPPHSIEIVADGGDPLQIAQQILDKKAGGIQTYGDTSVVVAGVYGEDITIRFNRPSKVYTWFHIGITLNPAETLPPDYVDLLRRVVLENMKDLNAGQDVVPQKFIAQLYQVCTGISYIDIKLYATESSAEEPHEYPDRSKHITARQRAYTTESMIEVAIDG